MEYTTDYTCFPNAPFPTFGAALTVSAGVRFLAGARYIFFLHNVQTGSGAHQIYLMSTGAFFLLGKAAGAWS
jgi:hypothetical protein